MPGTYPKQREKQERPIGNTHSKTESSQKTRQATERTKTSSKRTRTNIRENKATDREPNNRQRTKNISKEKAAATDRDYKTKTKKTK
jgi:hypothetical protein